MYSYGQQYDFVYDWLTCKEYNRTQISSRGNPNIVLEEDEPFMRYLEEKVFPDIDVDEINTKYELLYARYEAN